MPADIRPTLAHAPAPPAAESEPDGLPIPRRYWAILAIALSITLAVLDSAIANVALPTIARDLDASPAASVLVVNAYQLAIVVSLLPLAALGEIVGYRRVYQAGLILFTVASLGCAMARSIDMLVVARVIQGLGGAGIMGINGALVRHTYPQSRSARASASTPWWFPSPRRSGRRSPPPSFRSPTGPGCSASTCRSASPRSRWRASPCRRRRPSTGASTGRPPC